MEERIKKHLFFIISGIMKRGEYLNLIEKCYSFVGRPRLNHYYTEFPKKDARFPKIKNIPELLSDHKKGKIPTFNISAIGRLLWETLYVQVFHKNCVFFLNPLQPIISLVSVKLSKQTNCANDPIGSNNQWQPSNDKRGVAKYQTFSDKKPHNFCGTRL